ncbi:MAG: hypothetical protein FJ161_00155 [Gammaproteobacteria bacterium]|nr:hypothetical protein [Gammaproteobacteria bacterium]
MYLHANKPLSYTNFKELINDASQPNSSDSLDHIGLKKILESHPILFALVKKYPFKAYLSLSQKYEKEFWHHTISEQRQDVHQFSANPLIRAQQESAQQWVNQQLQHNGINNDNILEHLPLYYQKILAHCDTNIIQALYPSKPQAEQIEILEDFHSFFKYVFEYLNDSRINKIYIALFTFALEQATNCEKQQHLISFYQICNTSRCSYDNDRKKYIYATHPASYGKKRNWSCGMGIYEDTSIMLAKLSESENSQDQSELEVEQYVTALLEWAVTDNRVPSNALIQLCLQSILMGTGGSYDFEEDLTAHIVEEYSDQIIQNAALKGMQKLLERWNNENPAQKNIENHYTFSDYYYAHTGNHILIQSLSSLTQQERIRELIHCIQEKKIPLTIRREISQYISSEFETDEVNTYIFQPLGLFLSLEKFNRLQEHLSYQHPTHSLTQKLSNMSLHEAQNQELFANEMLLIQSTDESLWTQYIQTPHGKEQLQNFERAIAKKVDLWIAKDIEKKIKSSLKSTYLTMNHAKKALENNHLPYTESSIQEIRKSSIILHDKNKLPYDLHDPKTCADLEKNMLINLSSLLTPSWVDLLNNIFEDGLFNTALRQLEAHSVTMVSEFELAIMINSQKDILENLTLQTLTRLNQDHDHSKKLQYFFYTRSRRVDNMLLDLHTNAMESLTEDHAAFFNKSSHILSRIDAPKENEEQLTQLSSLYTKKIAILIRETIEITNYKNYTLFFYCTSCTKHSSLFQRDA